MRVANKIYIIGIGYRPLDTEASRVIQKADAIFTSRRLVGVFERYAEYAAVRQNIIEINNLDDTIRAIREEMQRPEQRCIVLLASGDPLFFGIGRRMIEEFSRDAVEILPDISSIQMAFARVRLPWDDAFLMSLHGGPDPNKRRRLPYGLNDLSRLLDRHGKIAILTDSIMNPSEIAKALIPSECADLYMSHAGDGEKVLDHNMAGTIMYVCERLGYPDERIWSGPVSKAVGITFADPNVVILKRAKHGYPEPRIGFGLREDEIEHKNGLITKDEVRAVTIHRLRLPERGVLWDIGAGSGSVSLEAARLFPGLRVFAVEKDEARANIIKKNIERYDIRNIDLISGRAPDVLSGLPSPDRVFIGGSSGGLDEIIEVIRNRMEEGIIVMNAATIETLHRGMDLLEGLGFSVEISQISVSRSRSIAGRHHLIPLNPVFILKAEKIMTETGQKG